MGKPTTYQRWMILLSVIGLIIAGSSVFIGIKIQQLTETDDPIIIPIHAPTPTNGGTPPPYEKPEMLLGSATIVPDIDSAEFQISVSNSEHVMLIAIHFYVDGVEDSYALELNNPISGIFQKTITRSSFSTYVPSSTITIYLIMVYFDEQGIIDTPERVDNVKTFSFLIEEEEPPYFPPEIIAGTFDYSIEETIFTFWFSTTYYELINSIGCYFVIDGDVFETATGQDYVIEMIHVESGHYQSFFDYTLFPLDVDVFLYLTVGYVDIEGEDDSYIVEELKSFIIGSETANGIGTNYIFVLIATVVALTILTKMKRVKNDG